MNGSDAETAAFTAGVELAAITLYREVVRLPQVDEAATTVCNVFARHHGDHAASFNSLLDQPVGGAGNASVLAAFRPMLHDKVNQRGLLDALLSLEGMIASTHLTALGVLTDVAAARPTATIHGVECQHVVVLARLLGRPVEQLCPKFEATAGAFDPANFPA
jgi:hypothetical protein